MPGDEGPQNFGLPSHTRQNEREQREQGALPDLMLAEARRYVCIEETIRMAVVREARR